MMSFQHTNTPEQFIRPNHIALPDCYGFDAKCLQPRICRIIMVFAFYDIELFFAEITLKYLKHLLYIFLFSLRPVFEATSILISILR